MVKTNYKNNGRIISYEVTEDGYDIFLDDKQWISQHEPFIPHPNLGYEGSCLKQIEELITPSETEQGSNYETRLSALEEENAMLYETLDDILMNVIPSMTVESEVN